jgi:hypothetical protein
MLQPQTLYTSWDGTNWRQSPFVWDQTLDEAKQEVISQTNSYANQILTPNDWYVTRQVENGTPVPEEWTVWRQSIRDLAKEKADTIDACGTKDDLNTYAQSAEYLTWPDSPQDSVN